ncbi:transcriptional regulator [Paenibacillus terrae]
MDNILDIRSLSRANKELKSMDRYFESIQKRARNFGVSSFQRNVVAINRASESARRLSNALNTLTSRLYRLNHLLRTSAGNTCKCFCCKGNTKGKSLNDGKTKHSRWTDNSLIKQQNKITTLPNRQNKIGIYGPMPPPFLAGTNLTNNPNIFPHSQSTVGKFGQVQKNSLKEPFQSILESLKFLNKPKDYLEMLADVSKAYKKITSAQVASMPSWMRKIKNGTDSTLNTIKSSSVYTQATSIFSSAPSWVKTGLKGAGKYGKKAIGAADLFVDVDEILSAKKEEKYKLIGKFVGGKAGNFLGKSIGMQIGSKVPYAGVVLGPALGFVLGELGEAWLGPLGEKGMEKVWYAKTHLKDWTKSVKTGIDYTTQDFKKGMNILNNEVDNKTNTINAVSPPLIDYWSKQFENFIGNQTQNTMGGVDNLAGKISRKVPGSSYILNKVKEPFKNKIYDAGNYLKNNVPGLIGEGIKGQVHDISEGTKNLTNGLNKFIQRNADPVKETIKKATSKTSDFLQMILDSPEKLDWGLFGDAEKTAARKVPNKSSRNLIASSRTYRANDRHRKTAVHSVKSSNRNTSNMQVNMPTGAIQVAVGERVNFDALASEVGKRFVAGFRQAMDNNKTARA